jgi:hypothetical protein
MAERDIVGGMFGMTPEMYQQGMARRDTATNVQLAGLTPGQLAGFYAMEAGTGLGRAAQGLLGVEDPQMQLISRTNQLVQEIGIDTPEKLRTLAGELQKIPGGAALAAQAVDRADKMLVSAATVAAKTREKVPPIDEQAATVRYNELVQQFGEVEGARKYREEQLTGKKSVAAAGVPAPGMVGISDIKGGADIVDRYTKEPKTKLDAVGSVVAQLQAVKTNPTLLPQVQRSLVKIVGDSQIGQNEVKNILGSSGFTADIIDGVNKFFTGAPTDAKIDDVLRGVKVMEEYYSKQYSSGRDKAGRVLGNAKLDQRTIDDLMPPVYRAGAQAPIYAVNPQTKERIMSTDGGKTWTPSK